MKKEIIECERLEYWNWLRVKLPSIDRESLTYVVTLAVLTYYFYQELSLFDLTVLCSFIHNSKASSQKGESRAWCTRRTESVLGTFGSFFFQIFSFCTV